MEMLQALALIGIILGLIGGVYSFFKIIPLLVQIAFGFAWCMACSAVVAVSAVYLWTSL